MIDFSMRKEPVSRFITLSLVCGLAVAANLLVMTFRDFFWFPIFLDTLFTAAVTFAFGFIPGIAVAVLTWVADSFLVGIYPFHPFILVAIVEVSLIRILKPVAPEIPRLPQSAAPKAVMQDGKILAVSGLFVRLVPIYFACVIAASVMGGLIDFVYHTMMGVERPHLTGTNAMVMAFMQSGIHVLPANILSRLSVNIIDRFVVVFVGYLIALGISLALQAFFPQVKRRHASQGKGRYPNQHDKYRDAASVNHGFHD